MIKIKGLDFTESDYEYFMLRCAFTERQKKILTLSKKGYSNVKISRLLSYSESTIDKEIKKIKSKIMKVIFFM